MKIGNQMRISSCNSTTLTLEMSLREKTPRPESPLLMMTSQVLSTSRKARMFKLMLLKTPSMSSLKEETVVMVLLL
jgi:hypothetical protein